MRLQLWRSLWGLHKRDGGKYTLEEIAKKAAEKGYVGVECSVGFARSIDDGDDAPSSSAPAGGGKGRFADTLSHYSLSWTPVALSSGPVWRGFDPFVDFVGGEGGRETRRAPRASPSSRPDQHAAALAGQLDAALALARDKSSGGLFLPTSTAANGEAVALAGSDAMGSEDALATLDLCSRAADERGFSLAFETHRGNSVLGDPWSAVDVVRLAATGAAAGASRLPSLCVDYSHWTCAVEAMPGDRRELDAAVERVAARLATRLHARVGDCQGAQVAVPWSDRDGEATEGFKKWWRSTLEAAASRAKKDDGDDFSFSVTPEFGPWPYQRFSPDGEGTPSVEELNDWAAETVREIFSEVVSAAGGRRN